MKLERFEKLYQKRRELEERYQISNTDEDREQIRAEYNDWSDEVNSEGQHFGMLYNMYESMKERNNGYLDIYDLTNEKLIPGLVSAFREYGVQYFTFSSGWSSANETAWEFEKNGCSVIGMMELNGSHKRFMSEDFEKVHGFLFKVF